MNLLIKLYRLFADIKHQILFSAFGYNSTCKHIPSCSKYTQIQIKKHGTIVGLWKGFRRILTCF